MPGWDEVHEFYQASGRQYEEQKLLHAYASLLELLQASHEKFTANLFKDLLARCIATKEWMVKNIYDSRSKDYQNEFRKMVYDNEEEMEMVIGKLEDNVFIAQQKEELVELKASVQKILAGFQLS